MSTNIMRRHAAYKSSGILSLGEVPDYWRISRIAHAFVKSNAGEVIDKSYWGEGPELLYTCNRTPMKSDFSIFPQWKRTVTNDLLLTRNGTPYVHKPTKSSIYSNVVQRITLAKQYSRDYLSYCLGHSALGMRGYGVSIESFNFDNWKSLRFAHPPRDEQTQIAKFLDYETLRIDALIEKQQQLIALLKEKRQAVISHAVTKGLNPDAPTRDSGVEWLGEVPAHWEVARLKLLTHSATSGPYGSSLTKAMYSQDGIRVYGQQQAIASDFTIGDYYISDQKFAEMTRYEVFSGDVLVTVMGTIGRVAVVPEDVERGIINPRLVRYKADMTRVLPAFLRQSLLGELNQARLRLMAQGSTMEGLNMQILGDLPVPYPPLSEQTKILAEIDRACGKLDELIESSGRASELLQERRTALISAAVTGKIDVRDWQPPQTQPEAA